MWDLNIEWLHKQIYYVTAPEWGQSHTEDYYNYETIWQLKPSTCTCICTQVLHFYKHDTTIVYNKHKDRTVMHNNKIQRFRTFYIL